MPSLTAYTSSLGALLALVLLLVNPPPLVAQVPVVTPLGAPWKASEVSVNYGATVAASPSYLAVSTSYIRNGVTTAPGCVQVFDASGRWLKTIRPPAGIVVGGSYWGKSLVLWGDLLLVGSSAGVNGGSGHVSLHHLTTGKSTVLLTANLGLGEAVAFNGKALAAGDYYNPGGGSIVNLYRLAADGTLTLVKVLSDPLLNAGAAFGERLELEGNLLAVGARGAGTSGRVYFYDSETGDQVGSYESALATAGSEIGGRIDLHAGTLIASANTGRVFVYDTLTKQEAELPVNPPALTILNRCDVAVEGNLAVVILRLTDGSTMVKGFDVRKREHVFTLLPSISQDDIPVEGCPVAMAGGCLVIGNPSYDYGSGLSRGIAYRVASLRSPPAFDPMVNQGQPAYGTGSAMIQGWRAAAAGPSQQCLLDATLSGIGITAKNKQAAYLFKPNQVRPTASLPGGGGVQGAGFTVSLSIGMVNANSRGLGFARCDDQNSDFFFDVIWETDSPGVTQLLSNAVDDVTWNSLVQSISDAPDNLYAVSAKAKRVVGLRPRSPATDSFLYTYSDNPAMGSPFHGKIQEGDDVPGQMAGTTYGELGPRVCLYNRTRFFPSFLKVTGSPSPVAMIMGADANYAGAVRVKQGDTSAAADGSPDPSSSYSSFVAETSNGDGVLAFRATTKPATGTTVSEGVWSQKADLTTRQLLRKGETLSGMTGVSVRRIIHFWLLGRTQTDGRLLALVQLGGTGINAATDQALVVFEPNMAPRVIIKEGDFVPGAHGSRVGVISKVDADAWSGTYAVIATLTGSSTKMNLVLLSGSVDAGASLLQMQPRLLLRKGAEHLSMNAPAMTFRFPAANHVNAGGAGCTGVARSVAWDGSLLVDVETTGKVRHLISRVGP